MDKDMLLVKAPLPPGWIDMGIGEASIVKEALMGTFRSLKAWSPSRKINFSYQEPRGATRLVNILQSQYKTPVTVTIGAKNGLFLVFKALKRMGYTSIVSTAPYWTSFPAIASEAGLEFLILREDTPALSPSRHVMLVTSPNNPDCVSLNNNDLKIAQNMGLRVIHDAAYSSKAYGFNNLEDLKADVKVFSAAKMFGLSGIRVGWVSTDWLELDAHLQDLNETITSGVCVLAQAMVADILSLIKENPEAAEKFYQESSKALSINRQELLFGLGESISKDTLKDLSEKNGMFVWLPVEGLNLEASVRHVKGEAFGSPGWVRLSIGNVTPTEAKLAGQRLGRSNAL